MKEPRFERLGGKVRDIQELTTDENVAIYDDLHLQRWGLRPHVVGSLKTKLAALRKILFGKVIWQGERPIAIQVNYRADTSRAICVDYINGGADKAAKNISPGSLLSYINGRVACEDSRGSGKLLLYSYGKANTEYKDQWCHRVPREFSGLWLP